MDDAITCRIREIEGHVLRNGFRFAACRADGKHSGVWLAKANEHSLYIGAKSVSGSLKISLHPNGVSRVAFNKEYVPMLVARGLQVPDNRAFVEWRRPPTPDIGAALVVSVKFPIDYLGLNVQAGKSRKPLFVFEAKEPGTAIEFGFFYSREAAQSLEDKLAGIGRPLFRIGLDDGDTVSIVVRCVNFDSSVIPTAEQFARGMRLLDSKGFPNPGAEQRNLNAILWNDPDEGGGTLQVVEIGGITVRRNN